MNACWFFVVRQGVYVDVTLLGLRDCVSSPSSDTLSSDSSSNVNVKFEKIVNVHISNVRVYDFFKCSLSVNPEIDISNTVHSEKAHSTSLTLAQCLAIF